MDRYEQVLSDVKQTVSFPIGAASKQVFADASCRLLHKSLLLVDRETSPLDVIRLRTNSGFQDVPGDEITWAENPTLDLLGLAVGKYNPADIPSNDKENDFEQYLGKYRLALAERIFALLSKQLGGVHHYLSSRKVADTALINNPSVAQMFAEALSIQQCINTLIEQESKVLPPAAAALVARMSLQLAQHLVDLGGGRGALQGHSVHLKTLVQTVVNVYFKD
ncbi:MAG: hypothetical protein JKY34_16440 [Kordiimonadaceae bacterium]|nr:hypothetical protein [Kordiimonadaceae bacterium]